MKNVKLKILGTVTAGLLFTLWQLLADVTTSPGGSGGKITTPLVYYVETTGNDTSAQSNNPAKPFATPAAAVAAANAFRATGDTNQLVIKIGAGNFYLGTTSLWATNAVTIKGNSSSATFLHYNGAEHSDGPAIMSNNDLYICDLSIICEPIVVTNPSIAINISSAGSGYALNDSLTVTGGGNDMVVLVAATNNVGVVTNITLDAVDSVYADGIYPTTGGSGSGLTVAVTNILVVHTNWSDQTCIGALSDSLNNNFYGTNWIYNCHLTADAHGIQLNPTSSYPACIIGYNIIFNSPNAPAQTVSSNAVIELHNFYADSKGPNPLGKPFSCGFQNFGGKILAYDGYIKLVSATNATECYGLTSDLLTSSLVASATNDFRNVVFDLQRLTNTTTMSDINVGSHDTNFTVTTTLVNCTRLDGSTLAISKINTPTIIFPPLNAGSNTTALTSFLSTNATLNFGSTAAGAVTVLTTPLVGVTTNSSWEITITPQALVALGITNGFFKAHVSAADTISVTFVNPRLVTAEDPPSGTFRIVATQYSP